MIEWRDEGAVLAVRQHGETSVIAEVFTKEHGLHAGIVRGGVSRKLAPMLQPGAQVEVVWKARLEEHLGAFTVEPIRSRAAAAMGGRLSLAGLNAVCALLTSTMAERDPHPVLYDRTIALLDLLGQDEIWPLAYLRWEMDLLEEMGFALDLSRCAVTGSRADLIYVSPKSGRAVSAAGAGEWAERMLPLPPVLCRKGDAEPADIALALGTTGYFIEHRLIQSLGDNPLPAARARLIEVLSRHLI